MEFEEMDREEEGTDTDTDINYNIKVSNAFQSLRSDPEEPPEVTPEKIVQLRPDHPPTPSTPTTTEMDEMSEVFFKELSNYYLKRYYTPHHGHCDVPPITSVYNERDLFKAWQSAVNNIMLRNVDWRDWRSLSTIETYQFKVVNDELMNSIMELNGHKDVREDKINIYRNQFYVAGYKTLSTFIKQFFRKSQDASELALTPEDEA